MVFPSSDFWESVLDTATGVLGSVFDDPYRRNMDFRYGRDDVFETPNPFQNIRYPAANVPSIFGGSATATNPFYNIPSLSALAAQGKRQFGMPSQQAQSSMGIPGQLDQDVEQFIRQTAAELRIDPDKAVLVASKEGLGSDGRSYNRQNNEGYPAYGPFQLYITGRPNGAMGDRALAAGIDPRDARQWRESVRFALQEIAKGGWKEFEAATKLGIGQWDGVGTYTGTVAQPQVPSEGAEVRTLRGITPAQFGQAGIDRKTAEAICGPVAAAAFARATGRNPSVAEALNIARDNGLWSFQTGMYGAGATIKLLERMGVPSQIGTPDKNRIIAELRAGRPVIIDTDGGAAGHYFVVEDYDETTGRFDFGESAKALRASGGRTMYTLGEIGGLGFGNPYQAIYMRTG